MPMLHPALSGTGLLRYNTAMWNRRRQIFTAVLGSGLALAGAELLARVLPPPRVQQIFWQASNHFELLDGVPVWTHKKIGRSLWSADCAAGTGQDSVALLGSSIFFGSRLGAEDTLGPQLQAVLSDSGDGPCVHNFSQPGFAFQNQLALARHALSEYRPRVVVWEIWKNSPNVFTLINDQAYNFGPLELDVNGVPTGIPLSPRHNRWLFAHSAGYRFLSLMLTSKIPNEGGRWAQIIEEDLPAALDLVTTLDASLILVLCPGLDIPFAETMAKDPLPYAEIREFAEAEDLTVIDLAEGFLDEEPAELRLDRCCHFNPTGMQQVAALIAPPVRTALGRVD